MITERPNALGHDPVEAANLINHRVRHSLTLVSKLQSRQGMSRWRVRQSAELPRLLYGNLAV
jgi:hypothetical protein